MIDQAGRGGSEGAGVGEREADGAAAARRLAAGVVGAAGDGQLQAGAAAAARPSESQIACSVLIPVYNEERYIERSVEAMRRQRFDGELEFIFADGGSSDRTRAILESLARQDPRIKVVDNPRRSVSSGLNAALAHARGRWAARMDAHAAYPDDYLARGVQRLLRGDTRWVSGPQVPRGDNAVSRAVALALASPLGRGGSRKWGTAGERSAPEFELDSGVFTGVWERATLLEYGGWDERWPRNSDSEMAGRFLARGERLICVPAMGAIYVPRRSLPGLWRQYLDYGEYRAKTARRHPHTLRRSHLLAPALALDAALAVGGPSRLRAAARAGLGAYAGALAAGTIAAARAQPGPEALLVAVVLPVMHFAHGLGFLRGVLRHGPPLAALGRAIGLASDAPAPSPHAEPVFNPSLSRR
jgi:succinoglycan biosynthesis protein ExoA